MSGRRRWIGALLTAALGAAAPPAGAHSLAPILGRHPVAFYVDASRGSDANSGRSPARAWRTLARVSRARLAAGDRVRLRRGDRWRGTVNIASSGTAARPIVLEPYGRGARPLIGGGTGACVTLDGQHITVRGLRIDGCTWAGVEIRANGGVVAGNVISHTAAGVSITTGANDALVRANRLVDNNRMSVLTRYPTNDDSGAFGVLVRGDGARIVGNLITGSRAFSYDYGHDGAAVEIFGAAGTLVAGNRAFQNDAFTELGHAGSERTTYRHNLVQSSLSGSSYLVTRGPSADLGPVPRTVVDHDTVRLTGRASLGFVCSGGCSAGILAIRHSVIEVHGVVGWSDGHVDAGGNRFWGGRLRFARSPASRRARPRWVDLARGDLRLTGRDAAVGAGGVARHGRPSR